MMERLRKKWPWVSKRRAAEKQRAADAYIAAQERELRQLREMLADEQRLRQPMATVTWPDSSAGLTT
jgi:hypothetical protein